MLPATKGRLKAKVSSSTNSSWPSTWAWVSILAVSKAASRSWGGPRLPAAARWSTPSSRSWRSSPAMSAWASRVSWRKLSSRERESLSPAWAASSNAFPACSWRSAAWDNASPRWSFWSFFPRVCRVPPRNMEFRMSSMSFFTGFPPPFLPPRGPDPGGWLSGPRHSAVLGRRRCLPRRRSGRSR